MLSLNHLQSFHFHCRISKLSGRLHFISIIVLDDRLSPLHDNSSQIFDVLALLMQEKQQLLQHHFNYDLLLDSKYSKKGKKRLMI